MESIAVITEEREKGDGVMAALRDRESGIETVVATEKKERSADGAITALRDRESGIETVVAAEKKERSADGVMAALRDRESGIETVVATEKKERSADGAEKGRERMTEGAERVRGDTYVERTGTAEREETGHGSMLAATYAAAERKKAAEKAGNMFTVERKEKAVAETASLPEWAREREKRAEIAAERERTAERTKKVCEMKDRGIAAGQERASGTTRKSARSCGTETEIAAVVAVAGKLDLLDKMLERRLMRAALDMTSPTLPLMEKVHKLGEYRRLAANLAVMEHRIRCGLGEEETDRIVRAAQNGARLTRGGVKLAIGKARGILWKLGVTAERLHEYRVLPLFNAECKRIEKVTP